MLDWAIFLLIVLGIMVFEAHRMLESHLTEIGVRVDEIAALVEGLVEADQRRHARELAD